MKQKLTPAQKEALAEQRTRLARVFDNALKTLSEPGNARAWFIPFLVELLATYYRLRDTKTDGYRLSKLIGADRRGRFYKLLSKCTNRDEKARSRWAAAMTLAVMQKVEPAKLEDWLELGHGVSGRASEYAKLVRQLGSRKD